MKYKDRREFLKFMGRSGLSLGFLPLVSACQSMGFNSPKPIEPIEPSAKDDLVLSPGLQWKKLISWGETLNHQNDEFGFNCDYLAFFPQSASEAILWVNHEYSDPYFVGGQQQGQEQTREQVVKEQKSVGGSLIKIKKQNNQWQFAGKDPLNRRLDAQTKIPFANDVKIKGKNYAIGTLGNCAGGYTPWKTLLTCEENYHNFYTDNKKTKTGINKADKAKFGWDQFFNYPPEHYGWVVEVDPLTGASKKHTSLGRFAHECATVTHAKDGRIVVYSGDDHSDECLYKLISNSDKSIEQGELYVADTVNGKWLPLHIEKQPLLKKYFKNQLEVLTHTRYAADLLGASKLDRPEDIEIDPKTGHVYVSLTNNKSKNNFHGSILKIVENNNDPASLKFKASTFLAGGELTGFSSPDNMVFDAKGNLWMTNDISGKSIGKPPYTKFKNNGLFYIPMSGVNAGQVYQVASAPNDAELTGPCFSDDGRTLFVSVQHPGELSRFSGKLTSHWPDGGNNIPRPSVVTITGPALDKLLI